MAECIYDSCVQVIREKCSKRRHVNSEGVILPEDLAWFLENLHKKLQINIFQSLRKCVPPTLTCPSPNKAWSSCVDYMLLKPLAIIKTSWFSHETEKRTNEPEINNEIE